MLTTHHSRAAVAALLVASALRAGAQAPVVTASGDPSLRSDSIYKLAIDKPEYPDQSTLVLLDDGIVRLEKDGRASRTYHQIIQILAEKAVENYQEHSFSWVPGRQALRINWFRVVLPNGTVVSDKPSQTQDSDVPAEMSDPVYSDERVRRLSISGVKVGTLVDFCYTIDDTARRASSPLSCAPTAASTR